MILLAEDEGLRRNQQKRPGLSPAFSVLQCDVHKD
jgi:hypothetical protein